MLVSDVHIGATCGLAKPSNRLLTHICSASCASMCSIRSHFTCQER